MKYLKYMAAVVVVGALITGCGNTAKEQPSESVQKVEEPAKIEPAPKAEPTPEELEAKRLAEEKRRQQEEIRQQRLAEERAAREAERKAEQAAKQAVPRVEAYVKSLPGSQLVIVKAGINGVSVDCDYNVGDVDREAAKAYATDLIYDILDANSDCTFSSITINCMNGKKPVGALVQYDKGEIFSN